MSNRNAVNPRVMSYTGIYFEPCLTSKFNKNCRKRSFWNEPMEFITCIMGVQKNCVPVRDKLIFAISEIRVNDAYYIYFISIRSMCVYAPKRLSKSKPGHSCHENAYHLIVDSLSARRHAIAQTKPTYCHLSPNRQIPMKFLIEHQQFVSIWSIVKYRLHNIGHLFQAWAATINNIFHSTMCIP